MGGRRRWSPRRRRSPPTIRRPSRGSAAALAALVAARAAGRSRCPGPGLRVGPVPAALPGTDDRRHRDQGQDHDSVADRRDPGRRPAPPGRPRRQHRDPARGAAAGAHAEDHRVVIELSELQLPTLSRGTTVAVYTNVTSDHLDRHGIVDAYRRVKRRLAELVDPDGALVLNVEDPVVGGYAGLGTALRPSCTGLTADRPVASASSTTGSWRPVSSACRSPAAGPPQPAPAGGSCPSTSWASRAATTCPMPWPRLPWRCCSAWLPTRSAAQPRGFTGVEHRLESVAAGRRRPVRQRLAGHPAGRGDRRAAGVSRPDRAHRRRPRQGRRPLSELAEVVAERAVAAVLIGESGPSNGGSLRAAGLRTIARAESMSDAVNQAATLADEAGRAAGETAAARPGESRPCSSARPPRGSTCSRTTRRAGVPSRRPSPASAAIRPPRPRCRGGATDGFRRPFAAASTGRPGCPKRGACPPIGAGRSTTHGRRSGVTAKTNILKRERHQPDWSILVAVVALAAIGILMVYSSSAMRLVRQE